jgi:hypothetical protein
MGYKMEMGNDYVIHFKALSIGTEMLLSPVLYSSPRGNCIPIQSRVYYSYGAVKEYKERKY